MRSAGCIVNDILDREFDAKVFRTKNRPIASGKVSIKLIYWINKVEKTNWFYVVILAVHLGTNFGLWF